MEVSLRSRSDASHVVEEQASFERVALVVCDVWGDYWCRTMSAGIDALAPRIGDAVDTARRNGALIIHAPSWLRGGFYNGYPGRRWVRDLRSAPGPAGQPPEFPLPAELQGGDCPDSPRCSFHRPTRQHRAISIEPDDAIISEQPADQLFRVLRERPADLVLVAGIHTNICVLDQPYGLRRLVWRGARCALLRDLTEAVRPGTTTQVVELIERHLCPTVASGEIRWA